jgi:hypothetical protein
MKEQMRAEFEAWIKKNYFNSFEALTKKDDGNYWNFEAKEKWEIWQAAIDSTEAKLASREDKLSAVPANHIADADKMVEPLRDAIASCLTSVYICNRVWSAWSYGTMSQDDFIEARETEFLDDLVGVVMSVMQSQAQQPAYEDHDTAKHHEWLKKVETENAGKANELICDVSAQEPSETAISAAMAEGNKLGVKSTDSARIVGAYLLAQQPAQELNALAEMEARKDAAYLERNQVVAALAKCFPSGIAKTAIEGWSEDWHSCVYINLPTGQASWHYHDSQAYLFSDLPVYKGEWDGHTTEEKYARIARLKPAQEPVMDITFSQFLSDVHTAAGLVSHGKQCKALGERLGKYVMKYREPVSSNEHVKQESKGYCKLGDACNCWGDLPRIREGCSSWVMPPVKEVTE